MPAGKDDHLGDVILRVEDLTAIRKDEILKGVSSSSPRRDKVIIGPSARGRARSCAA